METDFGIWLKLQLEEQDMTQSELAEKIGVQPPQISRIISGERGPTTETLIKMADALRMPREKIFRAAGIIAPEPNINETVEQILHETQSMSEQDQQEILAFIRMKNNLRQQRKKK